MTVQFFGGLLFLDSGGSSSDSLGDTIFSEVGEGGAIAGKNCVCVFVCGSVNNILKTDYHFCTLYSGTSFKGPSRQGTLY